jgi:hypothetical protein
MDMTAINAISCGNESVSAIDFVVSVFSRWFPFGEVSSSELDVSSVLALARLKSLFSKEDGDLDETVNSPASSAFSDIFGMKVRVKFFETQSIQPDFDIKLFFEQNLV